MRDEKKIINNNDREILVRDNRFYVGEDNIINVDIGQRISEEDAKAMRDTFYKLIDIVDGKSMVFVNNSKSGKPSPEARKIFMKMTEREKVGKIAIFRMNPVVRIIASFVVGLSKNKDIQIFKKKEEALAWLKE